MLCVHLIFLVIIKKENYSIVVRLFEMKNLEIANNKNYLSEAMKLIAKTGNGPKEQIPSSGCSIKWK